MTLPKGWGPGGIPKKMNLKARLRPFIIFVLVPIMLIIIALAYLPIHIDTSNNTSPIGDRISDHIVTNVIIPVLLGFGLSWVCYRNLYTNMVNNVGNALKWKKEERKPLVNAKFFNDWGNEDAIAEFDYIEKIAYIGIPIMILLNSIYYISLLNDHNQLFWQNNFMKFFGNISFERFQLCIIVLNIFLLPLSLFFIFILSRSFRFYLAKASMTVAKGKPTKLDKMKYTMVGVKAYSKFLTRNLSLQLDEPKIYSKILVNDNVDYNELVNSFNDNNKLEPLKHFNDKITCNADLVLKVTKVQLVKDSIEFIVGILPIAFGILAIVLPPYFGFLQDLL